METARKRKKPKEKLKRLWLCFSKLLLIADYAVLFYMLHMFKELTLSGHDTTNCAVVLGAWIAQIAISSGAYYWKAKAENLVKMPVQLLIDLPDDFKERADPNQIISSVVGIGTNQN